MTAERKPQGEPSKMPESSNTPNKMPVPWRMYLAIIILGLTTISMVSYGFHKGQTMAATYAPLVDAAMEIKFEATTSHLVLEEILSGDRFGDIDSVWRYLDQSDWYARAMLEGGRSAEGIFLPLRDADLRADIHEVRARLAILRKASQQRLAAANGEGIQSEVDRQYHAAFDDVIKQADDVETQLQRVLTSDLRRFRWMQWALIVICFLLWLTIGLILHRFVRRRSAMLRASNEANETLLLEMAQRQRAELALRNAQAELLARERRERELVGAELAKTRKELVNATRLAVLGQLTATVSHELRNPLGSIRTAVFSVAEEVRGHTPLVDRALARAERNIIRCDQIIEELLDYTRTKKPELKLTDIDPWLGKVLNEQNIPEHIGVIRNFNADRKIDVDREQLRRCLINLLTNACQAMKETQALQARLTVETLVEENRLSIHVRDTGRGISPDNMEKIFEPLYTTKGFGIGLGLPVVQQIMKQLGGGVSIKSKPHQGTTASLWLPLTPQKDQQKKGEQ